MLKSIFPKALRATVAGLGFAAIASYAVIGAGVGSASAQTAGELLFFDDTFDSTGLAPGYRGGLEVPPEEVEAVLPFGQAPETRQPLDGRLTETPINEFAGQRRPVPSGLLRGLFGG